MITGNFLNQLDRFSILVRKRVTSNYAGPKRSIAQGKGIVFKEHRIYAPGDDIRAIDWNVYARTDDYYVKVYEEERNFTVHIIIDMSNSMNFGKKITKFDYASMIGVGFGYLAIKDNNKFQYSTFAEKLEVFQAKRGMSHLGAMISHLNNVKTKGVSKIKDSIFQYRKMVGSRSLLVIISDFLIDIEEIREALYNLGDHEIKVVQVLDPVEKDLNMEGDFRLKDSETNSILKTFISPRQRVNYQKQLAEHSAEVEKTCSKLGISFYQITTDTPIFDAFYRILE
ncbi:MAG: DUF58 domain-containing protein [Nanoarchaeota archaeon]|nr:DUF58 domain-containing protein [Nanoarchaeota archaeon]